MTGFGLSAKYVDALNKQAVRPKSLGDYPALRAIASTGSTLIHESDYLYEHGEETDLHVASVSGGTDLLGLLRRWDGDPAGLPRRAAGADPRRRSAGLRREGQPQREGRGRLICAALSVDAAGLLG